MYILLHTHQFHNVDRHKKKGGGSICGNKRDVSILSKMVKYIFNVKKRGEKERKKKQEITLCQGLLGCGGHQGAHGQRVNQEGGGVARESSDDGGIDTSEKDPEPFFSIHVFCAIPHAFELL